MTQDEFRNLLHQIKLNSLPDFSGVGIIVCDSANDLPIISLRDKKPDVSGSTAFILSKLSSHMSEYHDGFHIINSDGGLTHIAQYFSPPIVKESHIDKLKLVGGRFVAALFGSTIKGVSMTGVLSKSHGLSIFKNGKEVHFEEFQ